MKWILNGSTGKWHAWRAGGLATVCGRIDTNDLRKNPAKKISEALPADQNVCATCTRKTGVVHYSVDATTSAWLVTLRMYLSRIHARIHDKLLLILAERLAEVGKPGSFEGQQMFEDVRLLLLRPFRECRTNALGRQRSYSTFPHLKAALEKLPPGTQALQRVVTAVRCWRNLTKGDLSTARYRADVVVETILQLPTPEPYILHLKSRDLHAFVAIFHPNTLARAKKEPALRGFFSGSTEYWDATATQLNIVTD